MRLTIVVVPLTVNEVFGVGSVVTAAEPSIMIINSNQVVYLFLAFFFLNNPRGEIESLYWKIHVNIELVTPPPGATEPLEVGYQYVRGLPQVELFACAPMFFTPWTIPHVLLRKNFSPCKCIEALIQRDTARFPVLSPPLVRFKSSISNNLKICESSGSSVTGFLRKRATEDLFPGLLVPVNHNPFAESDQRAIVRLASNEGLWCNRRETFGRPIDTKILVAPFIALLAVGLVVLELFLSRNPVSFKILSSIIDFVGTLK